MTLFEIEEAVSRMYGIRQHIIVPNISWGLDGLHECDLLVLTKSKYAIEIEIKRSRADLKKDAQKKHGHKNKIIRKLYFAMPNVMEKHIEFVPEDAGIILCYKQDDKVYARVFREAKVDSLAPKLTDGQVSQLTRLGCMRIWGLKQKIIKLQNENNHLKIKQDGKSKQGFNLR